MKGALPFAKGFLYAGLEGAYTDPFLYIREKYDASSGIYGVGYDATVRIYNEGLQYLRDYIGYQYGNDALVGELRFGYREYGRWSAGGQVFYMLHGVMDMDSLWGTYSGAESVPVTPSAANPFETTAKDTVATYLVLSGNGSYAILPGLDLSAELDWIAVWNKGNVAKDLVTDLQVTLGISYSL